MKDLLNKYAAKLVRAGMAEEGGPLLAGLDAGLFWNREGAGRTELARVFDHLNVSALLLCPPAEPYRTALDFLARRALETGGSVTPSDCETRTFLHDLPVASSLESEGLVRALSGRKAVLVPGAGVVTLGTVGPEQAFVTASSALFACFVKFFSDHLEAVEAGEGDPARERAFDRAAAHLDPLDETAPDLMEGPLEDEARILAAMAEAGRATVERRLVDSYFGNVSCLLGKMLYISQTGSSLTSWRDAWTPAPWMGPPAPV